MKFGWRTMHAGIGNLGRLARKGVLVLEERRKGRNQVLIRNGIAPRIGRVQIQFHLKGESQVEDRNHVRAGLERSHDCAWSYPFIWEEWRLRE